MCNPAGPASAEPSKHPPLHVLTQAATSLSEARPSTLSGPPLSKPPSQPPRYRCNLYAALAHIYPDWPGHQSPGSARPTLRVSPPIVGLHLIHKLCVPSPVNMDQSFARTATSRRHTAAVLAVRYVDPARGARVAQRKQLGLTASSGPSVESCYIADAQRARGPVVPSATLS